MKYFLLFSTLFLSACTQAQAPRSFYFAAGVNQTNLKSDDLFADPSTGFKGGITFNMGYHETYNYQVEVMYNHSSMKLLTVNQDFEPIGSTKYNYNSIDLGLYFNYYILKPEEDEFYLGPQAGMTLSFGEQLNPAGGSNTDDQYYLPYLLQENNLGSPKLNYSVGLGLTGGYNRFRFDLRYSLGLNNVLSESKTNSYDEYNQYTGPSLEGKLSTISFTVSYQLWRLL